MSTISIIDVLKQEKTVTIKFEYSNDLSRYIKYNQFEYSLDECVSDIPDGIAIIPFICNILPVAWVTDSILEMPEIDHNFWESIGSFKQGYIDMYPMIKFKGTLKCDKICQYEYLQKDTRYESLLFFSGGVDAYASLIAHIEEKPLLVTLNGSDIKLSDREGWRNVVNAVDDCCAEFELSRSFVQSNFREILDEGALGNLIKISGDGWWHGFQHGIGLIGHAAPLCYLYRINSVIIASTYSLEVKGLYTLASDPTIDNKVSFINTKVIHDQYEYNRQKKVDHICHFVNETGHSIKLRVCWESSGGNNCCHCEKCYRTIMGIIATGSDPNDFNLLWNKDLANRIKRDINESIYINRLNTYFWKDIQSAFRANYKKKDLPKEVRWIYNFDFDKVNETPYKRFKRLCDKYPHLNGLYVRYQRLKSLIKY